MFGYPKLEAAHVALETVKTWFLEAKKTSSPSSSSSTFSTSFSSTATTTATTTPITTTTSDSSDLSIDTVIFNVFTAEDDEIYRAIVDQYFKPPPT